MLARITVRSGPSALSMVRSTRREAPNVHGRPQLGVLFNQTFCSPVNTQFLQLMQMVLHSSQLQARLRYHNPFLWHLWCGRAILLWWPLASASHLQLRHHRPDILKGLCRFVDYTFSKYLPYSCGEPSFIQFLEISFLRRKNAIAAPSADELPSPLDI